MDYKDLTRESIKNNLRIQTAMEVINRVKNMQLSDTRLSPESARDEDNEAFFQFIKSEIVANLLKI